MKSLPQTQFILVTGALAFLTMMHCGRAAEGPDAVVTLDPAFTPGLAKLEHATGFIQDSPNQSPTDWRPNLQLLVGVKAVEGSKRTIYFVQLTTLPPPATSANGQRWHPVLRTNDWAWSPSNKTQFVTTLYPVRARVFDEAGQLLKEGQTPMAWGMLTNGLMDLCRLGFEAYHHEPGEQSLSPADQEDAAARLGEGKESGSRKPGVNDDLARATGGGFLWMIGMFSDLQTVPAVANVWDKAQCAIRWPSLWTIVTSFVRGLSFSLEPQLKEVTLLNAAASDPVPLYRLPVKLNCEKRNLSRIEIIVGPAHGAEMLLAGVRSIHARHPTRPKHEFLAQVLAAGSSPETKQPRSAVELAYLPRRGWRCWHQGHRRFYKASMPLYWLSFHFALFWSRYEKTRPRMHYCCDHRIHRLVWRRLRRLQLQPAGQTLAGCGRLVGAGAKCLSAPRGPDSQSGLDRFRCGEL